MPRYRGTRQSLLDATGGASVTLPDGLLTSLVAHWKLNEASGNRADSYGSSTLSDAVGLPGSTAGKIGDAVDLDAMLSQALTCADNAALSMGDIDFTISCWLYLDSKSASMAAICKGDGSSNGDEYAVGYDSGADRFYFLVGSGAANGTVYDDVLGSPSTGVWYFVIAEHNASANTLRIRTNNSHSFSASYSSGSHDSGSTFAIGRLGSSATGYWDGRVDSVSIWKRTLTVGEQASMYNGGSGLDYPFS